MKSLAVKTTGMLNPRDDLTGFISHQWIIQPAANHHMKSRKRNMKPLFELTTEKFEGWYSIFEAYNKTQIVT